MSERFPEGWKLVPVEPTEEMVDAGEQTFVSGYKGSPVSTPSNVYAAMLSAAPPAPAGLGDGDLRTAERAMLADAEDRLRRRGETTTASLSREPAGLNLPSEEVRDALQECADDLEAAIDGIYKAYEDKEGKIHPAMAHKYERDMEPVRKARAILSLLPAREAGPVDYSGHSSTASHTPGPWRVDPKRQLRVVSGDDCTVASAGCDADLSRSWEANARFIAAAPDMLAALEGVVRVADRATVEFDAALAAIRKAKGE